MFLLTILLSVIKLVFEVFLTVFFLTNFSSLVDFFFVSIFGVSVEPDLTIAGNFLVLFFFGFSKGGNGVSEILELLFLIGDGKVVVFFFEVFFIFDFSDDETFVSSLSLASFRIAS